MLRTNNQNRMLPCYSLRGTDTLAKVGNLLKMNLLPVSIVVYSEWKGVHSTRKEFAPWSKFFPCRVDPFSTGSWFEQ